MAGKGVGWAGLVPGRRCGKGVGNARFHLPKYVKKNQTKPPLGVVSKALNPDAGMVLCVNMENSCLVSSQGLCILTGGWLWAQGPAPSVGRGGSGSGGDQECLVHRLHTLPGLSAWY